MGFYISTYLCNGDFDTHTIKKQILLSNSQIIESHEWLRGYVNKDDLEKVLHSNKDFKHIKFDTSYEDDLFLMETNFCSLDCSTMNKYILVQKNCSF
jgi:hypothetical protein